MQDGHTSICAVLQKKNTNLNFLIVLCDGEYILIDLVKTSTMNLKQARTSRIKYCSSFREWFICYFYQLLNLFIVNHDLTTSEL
jgi:hypothetical protein